MAFDFSAVVASVRTAIVDLPSGGSIKIREFIGDDILRIAEADKSPHAGQRMAIRVLVSAVDDNGNRLFADSDLPRLQQAPSAWLVPIAAAVNALNSEVFSLPNGG